MRVGSCSGRTAGSSWATGARCGSKPGAGSSEGSPEAAPAACGPHGSGGVTRSSASSCQTGNCI